MTEIKYPLAKETINEEDIDALCQWLKTYPRLTKASLTPQFEEAWAKYIGTKYAVFCNSGSSANLLMVYAAILAKKGLRNNKIVVPSVGWVTTVSPAIQLGLEPIMVGADPDTFGIDLGQLEDICKAENPAMVIFVQVLGVPHDRKRLLELKQRYGFVLLEDACAALGAAYANGDKVGTVGDMSTFSFYFGHQLSTIEGGMVNTNSKALYDMLLMLRSHGWVKDLEPHKQKSLCEENDVDTFHSPFTFMVPGLNLRSTDLQAFIGLRQVKKADWVSRRRNENHMRYMQNLNGVVGFQVPGVPKINGKGIMDFLKSETQDKIVSISFGALAKDKEHRTRIVNKLVENGVETRIFSAGNLGKHPFWVERYGEFRDPMSDKIHSCGFFVPNYPELTLEEVDFICELVKSA